MAPIPKMVPVETILYTRTGCHLCHQAKVVLARYGLEVRQIDIDQDASLRDRYGNSVPVVVMDGKERFRGRVDEVLLRRILSKRT